MSGFPKSLHRVEKISVTILTGLLIELEKIVLKFKCRSKGLRIANILSENSMRDFSYQILKPIKNQQ